MRVNALSLLVRGLRSDFHAFVDRDDPHGLAKRIRFWRRRIGYFAEVVWTSDQRGRPTWLRLEPREANPNRSRFEFAFQWDVPSYKGDASTYGQALHGRMSEPVEISSPPAFKPILFARRPSDAEQFPVGPTTVSYPDPGEDWTGRIA